MSHWYQQTEPHNDTKIIPSSSGYSNDEICLERLKHFEEHSKKLTKGLKRLLILDGHGSHYTIEFIRYCEDHGIIPFGMPPNLTHLLQPLNVVIFQPLKQYHAKAIDIMVRDGLTNITKIEFLSCIQEVRKQAIKVDTIRSSFKETGIWPFNPQVVLAKIDERLARSTPPPLVTSLGSSPGGTPVSLRQICKLGSNIERIARPGAILTPEAVRDIKNYIKGGISITAELIQVKRDLGRTKHAERVQKSRRALKNRPLRPGGVLSVADGRRMVKQTGDLAIEKARILVEVAGLKLRMSIKDGFLRPQKKLVKGGVLEGYHWPLFMKLAKSAGF